MYKLYALILLYFVTIKSQTQSGDDPLVITTCIYPKPCNISVQCPLTRDNNTKVIETETTTILVFSHRLSDLTMQSNFISGLSVDESYVSNNVIQEYDKPITIFQESKRSVQRSINVRSNPTWNIDRIDQRFRPLDRQYFYNMTENKVTIYVVDTGINWQHNEFSNGRRVIRMVSCIPEAADFDGNGHGTHVAATAGGSTYGVSPYVDIASVKVLNSQGSGSMAGLIQGLLWIMENGIKPYVVNLSLGGGISPSVDSIIAQLSSSEGVVVVCAAGNANTDACNGSPSRAPSAITVASSSPSDSSSTFTNYGSCVDIYAPGENIQSAWIGSNSSYNIISGTSMASPHIAGIAAVKLGTFPRANGLDISRMIKEDATPNVISNVPQSTPNLFSYIFPVLPPLQPVQPTSMPTSLVPTQQPTRLPTSSPTRSPTRLPTGISTHAPLFPTSRSPTSPPNRPSAPVPSFRPNGTPINVPTRQIPPTSSPRTPITHRPGIVITPTTLQPPYRFTLQPIGKTHVHSEVSKGSSLLLDTTILFVIVLCNIVFTFLIKME